MLKIAGSQFAKNCGLDRQVMETTDLPREMRQAIAKAKPSEAASKFNHEAKA